MVNIQDFDDPYIFSPLQKTLLKVLKEFGPQTRNDLINKLNLARTTIYDNLTRLQNYNLVRKFSRPTNSRGRPEVFFKLTEED